MSIMKIKNADGTWSHITAIQGEKGDKGDKGDTGLTPHIGENGNWWIGTTDTGVKATSESEEGIFSHLLVNGNALILGDLTDDAGNTYVHSGNVASYLPIGSISYTGTGSAPSESSPVTVYGIPENSTFGILMEIDTADEGKLLNTWYIDISTLDYDMFTRFTAFTDANGNSFLVLMRRRVYAPGLYILEWYGTQEGIVSPDTLMNSSEHKYVLLYM